MTDDKNKKDSKQPELPDWIKAKGNKKTGELGDRTKKVGEAPGLDLRRKPGRKPKNIDYRPRTLTLTDGATNSMDTLIGELMRELPTFDYARGRSQAVEIAVELLLTKLNQKSVMPAAEATALYNDLKRALSKVNKRNAEYTKPIKIGN